LIKIVSFLHPLHFSHQGFWNILATKVAKSTISHVLPPVFSLRIPAFSLDPLPRLFQVTTMRLPHKAELLLRPLQYFQPLTPQPEKRASLGMLTPFANQISSLNHRG